MQFKIQFFIFLFGGLLIYGCQTENNNADSPESETTSVTNNLELLTSDHTGIEFSNILEDDPLGTHNVLSFGHYYNGAGVAMGDFDNDGLTDLFFPGNEVDNTIYKNLGDLKFEDKTEGSGVNKGKVWASGAAVADINNDGLLDIYVSQCGPYDRKDRGNRMYINKGDFQFEEVAESWGIDDENYTTQSAFIDYDKDGDLDIFTLNESKYVQVILATMFKELEDEENLRNASCHLYRNNGDNTFTDITEEAGLLGNSYGLGVLITDFNNDNWPDIYVANDYSVPDKMYVNQKDGTFKDKVKKYTDHIAFYSMGVDNGDINNDGYLDIGSVDMATPDHFRGKTLMASMDSEGFNYYTMKLGYQYQYMFNVFQLNNGNGSYSDVAGITGLQKTDWSWAALLMDLNLDGFKDYFVSNGYKKYARDNDFMNEMERVRQANGGEVPMSMREEMYKKMPTIPLRNLIYMNRGDLVFEENPDDCAYPDELTFSYGTAYGDLDNDGDLEMVVSNIDEKVHILKNNTIENSGQNYLNIELHHPDNSALEYNAKVRIQYGDEFQYAENTFIRGYQSSMDQKVFFGLGDAEKVDKVEVLWPDNNLQVIESPKVNQLLKVSYEKGTQGPLKDLNESVFDLEEISTSEIGLDYVHKENNFEDFAKEVLLPQRQSTLGPALLVEDINNDGLEDVFVGGAMLQQSGIYYQSNDGTFEYQDNISLRLDMNSEDTDAVLVDPNNDGNKDMIVTSGGGGEMEKNKNLLPDRFYANLGNNKPIQKAKGVVPEINTSNYRLKTYDLNGNGNDEVIICGAAKPGFYPQSEPNAILSYQGNRYVDIVESLMPEFKNIPLVRDIEFSDFNGDGKMDLIAVSEWGKPEIFTSESDGTYKITTENYFADEKHGWWASIKKTDIDNDGDDDFIIGNMGENLKHNVSEEKPLYLYANDFDKNGTLDIVLAKKYKGKVVPARGRECSSEQMPFIKNKFTTYESFAKADVDDIYGDESIENAKKLKSTTFAHYLLRNENGKFKYEKLPNYAQIAPVSSVVEYDMDKDGYMDIILGGNYYDTEYETPRQDAGRGVVLMNNNGEGYTALRPIESGLNLRGNFRKMSLLKRGEETLLVAVENSGPLKIYKLP